MTHTAQIVKEIHKVHTRKTRAVMSWTDTEGKRHAKILNLWEPQATELLNRTVKWASHNGIEIMIRPA